MVASIAVVALGSIGLAAPAQAASPYDGVYVGENTHGYDFTLTVEDGIITGLDTTGSVACGLTPYPMPFVDVPAVSVAGGSFDISWDHDNGDGTINHYKLNGVFNGDTVSSEGYNEVSTEGIAPGCGAGLKFGYDAQREAVTYDPYVSVSPDSLLVSELAGSGITVSGGDFAPDSTVTLSIDGDAVDSQSASGAGEVSFTYTSSSLGAGSHTAEVSSADGSASAGFTVSADPVVYDPEASVTPGSLTQSELASAGVVVHGQGFAPNSYVILSIDGTQYSSATASDDGEVSYPYAEPLDVGTHTARLSADEGAAEATFTVTADPVVYDPQAQVTPGSLTVSELAADGVTVSGTGFAPDSEVTLSVDGDDVASLDADGDGAVMFTYAGSLPEGTHTAMLTSADGTAEATFTVTADPIVYQPTAQVAPASLTVDEIADTGVTITGAGFAPDDEVTLLIDGDPVGQAAADADGAVEFQTMGQFETGQHSVELVADSGTAEAGFEVTPNPAPTTIPSIAPEEDALDQQPETGVMTAGAAAPGDEITLTVTGADAGDQVGVWLFSTPVYLGAHEIAADGTVAVTIPADTAEAEHRIGVWAADDSLLGWAGITIAADDPDDGSDGDDDAGSADPGTGSDGDDDAGSADPGDGSDGDDTDAVDPGTGSDDDDADASADGTDGTDGTDGADGTGDDGSADSDNGSADGSSDGDTTPITDGGDSSDADRDDADVRTTAQLASTGSAETGLVGFASVLVMAGAVALAASRRRDRVQR